MLYNHDESLIAIYMFVQFSISCEGKILEEGF